MDESEFCHIKRLSSMAGKTIQNEKVVRKESATIKRTGDDLPGESKMLVLEQAALFENTVNEIELSGRIIGRGIGERGAKRSAEIEVMHRTAEKTASEENVSQRTLARAGRTEKKHCVNREGSGLFH